MVFFKILHLWKIKNAFQAKGLIFFLSISCIICPIASYAQITLGNTTAQGFNNDDVKNGVKDQVSFSHTVSGLLSDRLLLVSISLYSGGGGNGVTSVNYGATGMSLIAISESWGKDGGSRGVAERENVRSYIYSLVNPPAGSANVIVNVTGESGSFRMVIGAATYAGVDQDTPIKESKLTAASTTKATETSSYSGSISTLPGDFVYSVVAVQHNSAANWTGLTSLYTATPSNNLRGSGATGSATDPGTNTNFSVSWTGNRIWAVAAIVINGSLGGLPIELTSLTASIGANGKPLIRWSTATEKNNDFFIVQRSRDGKNFHDIAQLAGAGDHVGLLHYFFEDPNPLSGQSYYRLKQTNYDGTYSFSPLVRVFMPTNSKKQGFRLLTNPLQAGMALNILLEGDGLTKEELNLFVVDSKGTLVFRAQIHFDNVNPLQIEDFPILQGGVYLITIQNGNRKYSQRLLII